MALTGLQALRDLYLYATSSDSQHNDLVALTQLASLALPTHTVNSWFSRTTVYGDGSVYGSPLLPPRLHTLTLLPYDSNTDRIRNHALDHAHVNWPRILQNLDELHTLRFPYQIAAAFSLFEMLPQLKTLDAPAYAGHYGVRDYMRIQMEKEKRRKDTIAKEEEEEEDAKKRKGGGGGMGSEMESVWFANHHETIESPWYPHHTDSVRHLRIDGRWRDLTRFNKLHTLEIVGLSAQGFPDSWLRQIGDTLPLLHTLQLVGVCPPSLTPLRRLSHLRHFTLERMYNDSYTLKWPELFLLQECSLLESVVRGLDVARAMPNLTRLATSRITGRRYSLVRDNNNNRNSGGFMQHKTDMVAVARMKRLRTLEWDRTDDGMDTTVLDQFLIQRRRRRCDKHSPPPLQLILPWCRNLHHVSSGTTSSSSSSSSDNEKRSGINVEYRRCTCGTNETDSRCDIAFMPQALEPIPPFRTYLVLCIVNVFFFTHEFTKVFVFKIDFFFFILYRPRGQTLNASNSAHKKKS